MATTIRYRPREAEPRTSWLPLVVYPIITGAAFALSWRAGSEGGLAHLLAVAAVLLLALPLFVLVHEAGHVLAGWLVGFRLVWARAMLLQLWRSRQGFRWGGTLQGLNGGEVGMVPGDLHRLKLPEDTGSVRRRLIVLYAGGPVATLGLLGVMLLLLWLLDSERIGGSLTPAALAYLRMISGALAGASAIHVLLGFVPLVSPRRTHSDERQLRQLLVGGHEAEREVYRMLTQAYVLTGERPREWLPRGVRAFYLAPPAPAAEALDDIAALYLAYYCALDEGHLAEADALLSRYIRLVKEQPATSQNRDALLTGEIESVFLAALSGGETRLLRQRLELARDRAEEFVPEPEREQALLRAEAAVLRLEGQCERAVARADEALAALAGEYSEVPVGGAEGWMARRIVHGTAVVEREWLETIRYSAAGPVHEPLPQA